VIFICILGIWILTVSRQQSKLTASRFLRVRKLAVHVQEKLDKLLPSHSRSSFSPSNSVSNSRTPSVDGLTSSLQSTPTSSFSTLEPNTTMSTSPALKTPPPRAEDLYEILCNDLVLPYDMTLAAIRQFVWKQSSELVMHYRRKQPTGQAQGQVRVAT
jgi:WD repeat-containing protein 48